MSQADACPTCGLWTDAGKEKFHRRAREHPIYGTDFNQPLSATVEAIRSGLVKLRGQLEDIKAAGLWTERMESPIGGLTCVLVTLFGVAEEMRRVEATAATYEPADESPDRAAKERAVIEAAQACDKVWRLEMTDASGVAFALAFERLQIALAALDADATERPTDGGDK